MNKQNKEKKYDSIKIYNAQHPSMKDCKKNEQTEKQNKYIRR